MNSHLIHFLHPSVWSHSFASSISKLAVRGILQRKHGRHIATLWQNYTNFQLASNTASCILPADVPALLDPAVLRWATGGAQRSPSRGPHRLCCQCLGVNHSRPAAKSGGGPPAGSSSAAKLARKQEVRIGSVKPVPKGLAAFIQGFYVFRTLLKNKN